MIRQSPKHRKHPSKGAQGGSDPQRPKGGRKYTTTGGGADAYHGPKNEAGREAAANYGIQPADDASEFNDSSEGGTVTQGSTLTRAGIK